MKSVGIATRPVSWLGEKKLSRVMLILGGVLLAAIVVGLFVFLLLQDVFTAGTFPPGVSVVGVNVSGLSRTEAIERCRTELSEVANRPVALTVDGERYQITPEELGLKLEYDQMVDHALQRAWSVNIFERMARRFVNRPKKINEWLMAVKNEGAVKAFVTRAMGSINRPPQNAYVDVTSGAPVVIPAQDGRQAEYSQVLEATGAAIGTRNRTVDVKYNRMPALIPDKIFGKLIVVNLSLHQLTLYDRQTPLAQFPIACGQPAYPTPVGQWLIVGKQMNPTWYNPHAAWSATMPETIGPGYSNPLGLRALPLNASGVLIHGSSNDGSIGTSASHGCMRMHMSDVIKLFDMVEVGTPVYIIKSVGNPGFDVTATPSWRLKQIAPGPANTTYTGG